MDERENQTKNHIVEKCDFDYNRLPDLNTVEFISIKYPYRGGFVLRDNNVITFTSGSNPTFWFQNLEEEKFYLLSLKISWIEDQNPILDISKMSIADLEIISYHRTPIPKSELENRPNRRNRRRYEVKQSDIDERNERSRKRNPGIYRLMELQEQNQGGSIGLGDRQRIKSINKYSVRFKGKENRKLWNYEKSCGQIYELDIDIDIDVAFGIDLENDKTILVTFLQNPEWYKVYIGSREQLEEMGAFKMQWLNDKDKWLNFEEIRIK